MSLPPIRRLLAGGCAVEPLETRIAPAVTVSLDLTDRSTGAGLRIGGELETAGLAARALSPLGDFNGDGFEDFVIGAAGVAGKAGAAYVLFGPLSPDSYGSYGTNADE